MNTDPLGNFDYFLQFSHYFSATWPFLHFFLNEGGNTWTRGEFGQYAEFFMEILVQSTQATQAKVPKQC